MNILEFETEFKRKIIASGNDFTTAKVYGNCIHHFLEHHKDRYDSPLHITFRDAEDYVIHLVDAGYSASYINQFVASVKRFYELNGQTQKCVKLQYRNDPPKTPNVLTHDECMAMCNAPIYIKHRAIINLLYYAGLRRSELLDLKIEHISKDGKLTIIMGKFGKSRVVCVPEKVMVLLREYFKECSPKIYLFNGEKNRPQYSAKSVEAIIKNTARLCGIHKRTHPHLMRTSRATILLDNGASMGYVSDYLGHADIKTTDKYYHKLTIKSMQNQFEMIDEKLEKAA